MRLRSACNKLVDYQLQMIIFFALNVCLMIVTARTDKASDKEWFRIRFINSLAIVIQAILGVVVENHGSW